MPIDFTLPNTSQFRHLELSIKVHAWAMQKILFEMEGMRLIELFGNGTDEKEIYRIIMARGRERHGKLTCYNNGDRNSYFDDIVLDIDQIAKPWLENEYKQPYIKSAGGAYNLLVESFDQPGTEHHWPNAWVSFTWW